jgi:hypothetical protein
MSSVNSPVEDPHAALERMLIDEFLGARGLTRHSASELPAAEATRLLSAASEYASLLAEIENRAHYVDEIHRPS